jgi:short-subunit dehydrogenase
MLIELANFRDSSINDSNRAESPRTDPSLTGVFAARNKTAAAQAERKVFGDPRRMFKLIVTHLPEVVAGRPVSWKRSVDIFDRPSQVTNLKEAFDESRMKAVEGPALLPEQQMLLAKAQEQIAGEVLALLARLAQHDADLPKIAHRILNEGCIAIDEKFVLGDLRSQINRTPPEAMPGSRAEVAHLTLSPLFRYFRFSSLSPHEAVSLLTNHPASDLLFKALNRLLSPTLEGQKRVRGYLLAFSLCGELVAEELRHRNNDELQTFGRMLANSADSSSEQLKRIIVCLLDESQLTRALRAANREVFSGEKRAAELFKGLSRVALPARAAHSSQGDALLVKLVDATLDNNVGEIGRLAIATLAGDSGSKSPYLAKKFPTLRLLARELSASAPLIRCAVGLKSKEAMLASVAEWRRTHPGQLLSPALGREVQAVVALVDAQGARLFAPIAAAAVQTVTIPRTILQDVLSDERLNPAERTRALAHSQEVQEVILITGASQGIGRAIVDQLRGRTNCTVIATARESSLALLHSLRRECDPRFIARPLDVTKEADRRRLVQEMESRGLTITTLINNAGVCGRGPFEQIGSAEMIEQLQTNVLGGHELAKLIIPGMKRLGRGKIIAVSSLSGMMGVPTMGAYSATKFALEGLYEALYYELKPLDISVTLMQLGFIRSESFLNSRFSKATQDSVAQGDAYGIMTSKMNEGITKGMRFSLTTPETVAKAAARIIDSSNPPLRRVVGLDGHLFTLFRRIAPRAFFHWIVYNSLYGKGAWEKALRQERDELQRKSAGL